MAESLGSAMSFAFISFCQFSKYLNIAAHKFCYMSIIESEHFDRFLTGSSGKCFVLLNEILTLYQKKKKIRKLNCTVGQVDFNLNILDFSSSHRKWIYRPELNSLTLGMDLHI